jgi:hypothetical protein
VLTLLLRKQLTGCLPIVIYLFLVALPLQGVTDCLQVDPVLVRDAGERVECPLSRLPLSLLVPEYIVDPAVQILRHILRLKGLSHIDHEEVGVTLAPGRQLHVVNVIAILLPAEVDSVVVDEELWAKEELRDQLSHVCVVVEC